MSPFNLSSLQNSLRYPARLLSYSPAADRRGSCRSSLRNMSCSTTTDPPTLRTVVIPYTLLRDKDADLSANIEEGFGPNGLGILSIADVPGYSSMRKGLLRLAPRLARFPEEVKKELEDPQSRYNFGWSHRKEKLESGKPDTMNGSFYANPILDIPMAEASLIQRDCELRGNSMNDPFHHLCDEYTAHQESMRYPAYCGPNIWPNSALPELEVGM